MLTDVRERDGERDTDWLSYPTHRPHAPPGDSPTN